MATAVTRAKRSRNGSAESLAGLLDVLAAAKAGDFSVRAPVKGSGIEREIAVAVNELIGANDRMAREIKRVGKLVGRDGRINERAALPASEGAWKASTEAINDLIDDLVRPTAEFARVIDAVAKGDLSQKMALRIEGRPVRGEFLRIRTTVNAMVDRLSSFADEVTRVAREVGTEGKLGGQARVKGVSGVWKDLTDNVNTLAGNLTSQVRNIAEVTTAVANGDLSKKITVDVRGEVLQLKDTINTMVDQLRSFADEVTRVAREVGTEGKLGGQAQVRGVSGVWRDLTENVNTLAGNLTGQVRNIAQVATAVAKGDLSQKITVDARGEVLELKDTINTMVDQLSAFADEVTRVAREVGTEGKLGGQAVVPGASGVWKDLTQNVNSMGSNLTGQVRNIAEVTTAVAGGDLSQKITVDARGEVLQLKDTINVMVDQLRSFAAEVTRVAREVGTEGKLGGQANVEGVSGVWKDLTDNVNQMASNLTSQVRNIAEVTTAVARGDLSQKITVDVQGEVLQLKDTINTMVDQLSSFADEVTRVAREVGTEGNLGGQAHVRGVSGVWKDLTENVNLMASNLTSQVRNIAGVATAVAKGDLSQKITVDVRGEILELKNTLNTMVDQLSSFADEVTRVAREVGTEGKLGGQAQVRGVSGVWKDLTDNVNSMASSLTTQVRAIAAVSTAVTQGDLTRSITVEAQGEVDALKDTINQMIANLRETTKRNSEQDWLNSNLARFGGMMQGQRDLRTVSNVIMSELTPLVSAQLGAFFLVAHGGEGEDDTLELLATYGYDADRARVRRVLPGQGLVGQAAVEKKPIFVSDVPPDYVRISSSLGSAAPRNVVVLPALFEDRVMAVIELASFEPMSPVHQVFLEQLTETIGVVINAIEANTRTEELLTQSQSLAAELQKQQEELRETNAELAEKATLLADQNERIEVKNREIEMARLALEEKAEQLALSSQYKSEFLANISHELRTPLNSLLILAKLLADNTDDNLTDKQVEFARTILASGNDLLELINDILDLSKIEAGRMDVHPGEVSLAEIVDYVDRSFRPLVEEKGLTFDVVLAADLPSVIETDEQRLQQILRNLLSNAVKFTEQGGVGLTITATGGGSPEQRGSLAFSVRDTGIGIPKDRLGLIFEAFQQADGTTSRRFGGTGLGLSISAEIAKLLGGEIHVESNVDHGSVFTLTLPVDFARHAEPQPEAPAVSPSRLTAHEPGGIVLHAALDDDRDALSPADRVVLIVQDDPAFAAMLLEVAHASGFKGVVAHRGDTGFSLAHACRPDAILLDLGLPVMDGSELLARLKSHPATRDTPVHVISGVLADGSLQHGQAASTLAKPVELEQLNALFAGIATRVRRGTPKVLLVERAAADPAAVSVLQTLGDVEVTAVRTVRTALSALNTGEFACIVLDAKLPRFGAFRLLDRLDELGRLDEQPVVLLESGPLTPTEQARLDTYADRVTTVAVATPEQLLAETSAFLSSVDGGRNGDNGHAAAGERTQPESFEGKCVLIVDDDIRNVFALTSILEARGMQVRFAENGSDAIELLQAAPDVDVVLMDVMMPEMDGYETTAAIRRIPRFASLPVLAVTAKAMKEDRDRCIAAGASDYITKPVDPDELLAMIGIWLHSQSADVEAEAVPA